jgi:hypothetical protein
MQSRPLFWIVLLGVVLHLPALALGFYADDYLHQFALSGELPMKPWALFDFGEVADWEEFGSPGSFPWWTSPDWKARFFRPLASLSMWLDHTVYGARPLGYHVTSLALYALLIVLVHALYRALGLSARLSQGALLLFVCSTESALPVSWIANRNSLLAVLFTVAAVCAIARHRIWGRRSATLLALACATLAALSKESGAAAFLLVAAFLIRERVSSTELTERRWALSAAIGACTLAALHAAVIVFGDYGTNSLFYSMPWKEPLAYLERLTLLLAASGPALTSPLSTDLMTLLPQIKVTFALASAPFTLGLAGWTWRSVRGAPAAGFFALWILFTLLPQAAAQISDRLLFGPSVGSSALLAMLIASAFRVSRTMKTPAQVAAAFLLLIAGPLSGVILPAHIGVVVAMANDIRKTALTADVGPPELGHREVFILQAQNAFIPFTIHTTWGFESDDHDLTFRLIQAGKRGFLWTREDDRTVTFEVLGERAFLDDPFEYLYRSDDFDASPGTAWDAGLFTVESVRADEHGLRTIRVRFERSLDTPAYRFLIYRDERLTAIAPPAVGETLRIEPADPGNLPF